ncbi:MAG: VWA domain-containing protein [Vicinamibacterales bacterium]
MPLLFAASVALAAQDPPTQLEPFRTEVNYIRVDMYPTADGRPVTDLRQDEIEILDEGAPQKIDRFEHVLVRGTRSQETRREPATVAEMREATEDVRARLFVLFLDTEHVEFGPAFNIRSPLIQSLNQLIGGDDLVAVMTSGMEARDLTFRRRTTSIEELLKSVWSERDFRLKRSAEEDEIAVCFADAAIADEMIFRRREVRTLDALEKLVVHLRFVREERKAVIAISQGWRLYGDDSVLRRPVDGKPVEPVPPLGNDPRTGRLGVVERAGTELFDRRRCEQQRLELRMLRNELRFFDILRLANTGNTSFYPIDPRGLVVFEENIVPISPSGRWKPMVGVVEDSQRLKARNDSLRTMADVTDGIAVVQNGDLSAGMRRIVEDLSSYYLLGYYSTRDLDGKFHRLTVRVKRPGVRVRARTGYLAATRNDDANAKAAAVAVAAGKPIDARAEAVKGSLSTLGIFSRERPLRMHVASGYLPSGAATIWGVAEVPAATGRHDWTEGGQADVTLIDSSGRAILTERLTIASGVRSLRFALGSRATLAPGDYQVQIRAKGTAAPIGAMESVRVSLAASPIANGAVVLRRSVTTGNQAMPTADLRFRRTERIIIEVATTSTEAGTAQLLNRVGQAMPIPVAAAIREDADGARWRTAQLALAPLAPGDYVLEQSAGSEITLTAFRILP